MKSRNTEKEERSKRSLILDIAKIVSVWLIVIMHCESAVASYMDIDHWQVNTNFANGVWVLFTISAYLIGTNIEKDLKKGSKKYAIKKLMRIYPQYLAVLTAYIIVIAITPQGYLNNEQTVTAENILKSLLFNFGQLDSGYIGAAWFLYYIMSFYVIVGLAIRTSEKLKFNADAVKIIATIGIMLLGLIANSETARLSYISIASGLIGAILIDSEKNKTRNFVIWISYMLIIWTQFTGAMIGCFMISLTRLEPNINLNHRNVIKLLSASSYSTYLIQSITIPGGIKIANYLTVQRQVMLNGTIIETIDGFATVFAILLATIMSGVILHNLVGEPTKGCL